MELLLGLLLASGRVLYRRGIPIVRRKVRPPRGGVHRPLCTSVFRIVSDLVSTDACDNAMRLCYRVKHRRKPRIEEKTDGKEEEENV